MLISSHCEPQKSEDSQEDCRRLYQESLHV